MPDISLIVCSYNMARELPRTLFTLSKSYQRGIEHLDVEIIIIDNGSTIAPSEESLQAIVSHVRLIRIKNAAPSPVAAINHVVAATQAPIVGVMIDGARMASPRLIHYADKALRADPGGVVGSVGFHLGPELQMHSVFNGYNQAVEDELLDSVPWREDGYALFDVSVFAGSAQKGWFGPITESNAVFMSRRRWDDIGGLNEGFKSPGGGKANLEFWKRAVEVSGLQPWILLGEGTFHQVHGGIATNAPLADGAKRRQEYLEVCGEPFSMPQYRPQYIGGLCERALKAKLPNRTR